MASATASSTPPASPSLETDAILTPTTKVKTLLAEFDDSDSDRSVVGRNVLGATTRIDTTEAFSRNVEAGPENQRVLGDDAESDDGAIQQGPRGRLASRMQAQSTQKDSDQSKEDSGAGAYARIKEQIVQIPKPKAVASDFAKSGSSEDELQRTAPRRRLLKKKSRTPEDLPSRAGTRSPSPLFFPSPSARSSQKPSLKHGSQSCSDSDELPDDPFDQKGSKFLALVEKHRRQRLAREAAEDTKRAERMEQLKKPGSRSGAIADGLSDESDTSDGHVGKRLTQQARPTRKAGKKALEEMSRETQRMSRGMQLAHQAKTKKKITKESLLARFNFSAAESESGPPAKTGRISTTASSGPGSDVESPKGQNTPPTSPSLSEEGNKSAVGGQLAAESIRASAIVEDEPLPTVEDILATRSTKSDKGKGKAVPVEDTTGMAKQPVIMNDRPQARPIRVRWSRQDTVLARGLDSDSDLEIVTSKSESKKVAAFENLPQRKSREMRSHLILRSLANLQPISDDKKHASMNAAQMEVHLRRAARLQASKEREEKIEELRSRGIFVQTAEERQREQQEVEDLVEKARVEGAEIQRREKEVAKRDGTFVKDQLDDGDESEDEEDEDFHDDEEADDHLSGSEEEQQSESDQDDVGRDEEATNDPASDQGLGGLIDQEAADTESEEGKLNVGDDDTKSSEKENQSPRRPARGRRHVVLTDDDEDDEDFPHSSLPQVNKTPQSILRSARKIIPGLHMSDDLPIDLTQAFAATMADSGSEDGDPETQEQDSLILTRDLPSPKFHPIPSLNRLESIDIVVDSQPATQTQPLNLDLSLMTTQGVPQSPAGMSSTQFSFMPTQDVGCVMSPYKENRFDTPIHAPHSTIDTIILPPGEQSPTLQRRGRLRRGKATADSDDEMGGPERGLTGLGLDNSAFAVLQRAAKKVGQQAFDKAKSHAKDAVDEAAEESEDEYAGLGGASDDDGGVEDEADRNMIDLDEKLGQGDEGKLAGFYADKERKQDEAAVSKLLRDITTGALRRKRGAADDIDLSDEEDANARRREVKRREFARMRRELLKDEAVGKIAEDKKKQAFLKSIEDREELEDDDTLFCEEEDTEDSQSQPPGAEITDQGEDSTSNYQLSRKRPLEPSPADITNRPPPALRRTGNKDSSVSRKPSNLAEIREQLSLLIEETDFENNTGDILSSDDEAQEPSAYVDLDRHLHPADDESQNEDADEGLADFIVDDERPSFKKPQPAIPRAPATERRTKANVIDRLHLLRQSSSASSRPITSGSKLAFFSNNRTSSSTSSFNVPTLLRRATSNSSFNSRSTSAASATGVTERGAVEQEKEMVRRAQGGKRSAINYYAKGRVEERERVRQDRVAGNMGCGKGMGKGAAKGKAKGKGGFLGEMFGRGGSWE